MSVLGIIVIEFIYLLLASCTGKTRLFIFLDWWLNSRSLLSVQIILQMCIKYIWVRVRTAEEIAPDEDTIALSDMVLSKAILIVKHSHLSIV